jgi:hypothetical protein
MIDLQNVSDKRASNADAKRASAPEIGLCAAPAGG